MPTVSCHCPLCGHDRGRTHYRLKAVDGKATAAVACGRCGFVFMSPYPSDAFLEAHYAARDLYNADETKVDYGRAVADRKALMAGLLTRAGKTKPAGIAVDFGAGAGIAVAALRQLGYAASGLEANPQAQARARALFDVEVRQGGIEDLPHDLDVFTMFEVLEHIKFPRDFLSKVTARLRPGGVVMGTVPNYNGLGRYLNGTRSIALWWPEHINQFTRRSLRQTLEGAGLEVIYIGFPPPYGVVFTLGLRARLRQSRWGAGLVPVLTWIKKYIAYPLPNAFAEATGLLGHGLVFIARKPDAEGRA